MNYSHVSTEKERFSLHDCRAVGAELTDGRLMFRFPDGIYYNEYDQDWPNTGPAEVEFAPDPLGDVTVYLFTESDGQTVREEVPIGQMIERINARQWELEFAYRYDGYREILYKCWVWQQREPWSRECELRIPTREAAVFRWDPPAAK